MSAHDYEIHTRLLSEEEGGGYLATVPELPGCKSDGETPQEALETCSMRSAAGSRRRTKWEGKCRRRGGWSPEG